MRHLFNQNRNRPFLQLFQWCVLLCISLGVLMFLSFKVTTVDPFYGMEQLGFSVLLLDRSNSVPVYSFALVGLLLTLGKLKRIVFSRIGFVKSLSILFLSAFFSFFSLLSVYFEANLSVDLGIILCSTLPLISFILAFVGGILFFYIMIRLVWFLGEHFKDFQWYNVNRLTQFFGNHLYRNCIITISLCWLPQYIIRFPGVVPHDVWQSLGMHLGYLETTTKHPLIFGTIVGSLTELGVKIGINWLAPLVLCLAQHILSILIIVYIIDTLKKLNFNVWVLSGVLVFYIILPPMSLYASTLYNDVPYYLSIMLLTVELVYYLYDRSTFFSQRRHLILTAIAIFGSIFRYSGLYTMLAVIAVVSLRELCLLIKRKGNFKHACILVLICMMPLLAGQVLQNSLNAALGAKEIRSRAMFALPIQQSVRCLITHGESIDKEDYEAIHAVLTWTDEEYAEKYNPRNFDGVKGSFKTDATKEEFAAFLKAWLHLVMKYPKTCFMATANQMYYLFSPLVNDVRYYLSILTHGTGALNRGFDATPYMLNIPILYFFAQLLFRFFESIFPQIPVLGLLTNTAFYNILLLAICLACIFRKDRRVLVLAVALLATLGITFLGPAIFNHPRYIFPIMFSMPVLLATFTLPQETN